MEFDLIEGLPEEPGRYLFVLRDDSVCEGYYKHKNRWTQRPIALASYSIDGSYYYLEANTIKGWLRKK